MKNLKKLTGIAAATAIALTATPVVAENACAGCDGHKNDCSAQPTDSQRTLARQQLIDALKSMKKDPEKIEFHSAMCYKMALSPDTCDYSCPSCGKITTYQYHSLGGKLARQIATVRRSLDNLAVKIDVDESSLCQKCQKGNKPELVFTTACGNCNASFTWKIVDDEQLDKLEWLFLKYPVSSLDIGPGVGPTTDPQRVKSMVEFVSGCTFCPDCIKKLDLDY